MHGMKKLSERDIESARKLDAMGIPRNDIARRFNVHKAYIGLVLGPKKRKEAT
jgi:predicted Ser/Thr protein kinase